MNRPAETDARPPALAVHALRKQYGDLVAVAGIGLEVRHDEIVGLLGPNGAGKTTTINMLLGILEPSDGRIQIEGIDLLARRREALSLTNFAAIYAPMPGNMTVYENLKIFGMLYGVRGLGARIETLLDEFDLMPYRNRKCGVLSSGEQTRVALAKAMLNEPPLLLLDEPTASLDPASAHDIRARLRAYAGRRHCGVLWTSHNMSEVAEVCDRVLFLSRGRILLEGDPRALPRAHGRETLEDLFIHIAREPLAYGAGS
ncbi:ABC transporter ATP-binding protein [Acidihalobacter prosperus]|uniref:ABC transporter ATP-binding protein n=1 Tax=Acidihalobacter prosperus TaxID=160660 RepID=A0A1A6C2T7_9GAMM|nr:ABC transporter ATP-binding protein [Acidihalobacter prosperus]OBS08860.1 ABC transporter ATP-binding protein [Acidihalobacter prosperus]